MRAQITLKSGVQIEVEMTDLTTSRNKLTNQLTAMEWKTPRSWSRKLHTIELDQIAAVVMLRDPEPSP